MPIEYAHVRWPTGGVVRRLAYQDQQSMPHTTADALNVRPDDVSLARERGGSRPGLGPLYPPLPGTISLLYDLQWVNTLTPVIQSGQVVNQLTSTLLAASGQSLFQLTADEFGFLTIASPAPLCSDFPPMAVDYQSSLYIAGDNSWQRRLLSYSPLNPAVAIAAPSAGTVPNYCQIVGRWRDRLVLAGNLQDPNQWYMSAVGDATNWDYTAAGPGQAIDAQNADAGQVGEAVRAFVPHSHNCCLFGCDSSLWILRGDPTQGGLLSPLSQQVGILDRFCWTYDPEGHLWFLSRDGLYTVAPGCSESAPVSVSREKLPQELLAIDTSVFCVRMSYDFAHRGIHIWVVPYQTGPTSTHWWLSLSTVEYRDAAISYFPLGRIKQCSFWPMSVPAGSEPTALFQRREYVPDSIGASTVLLGGRDGLVRRFSLGLAEDNSTVPVSNYVCFGPFELGKKGQDGRLLEVVCTLAAQSGPVFCDVRVGENAEAAFNASAFATYAFNSPGANYTVRPRARGNACVLKFYPQAGQPWALEELLIRTELAGRRRLP